MSHHHHHASKKIGSAFFINLLFTVVEIIGGLWTNSLAILSDALHDLGDSIGLGLSWYLEKKSAKGRTSSFSYGYKRFSLLGSIISGIILITGSVLILTRAIPALFAPQSVNALGMIYLAILGVLFNGIAVFRLRGGKSMNQKLVFWHMMEDVLGWIAVLLGSLVIYIFDTPIIDPILSIGISLFVVFNAIKYLRSSVAIFLQAVPDDIETSTIEERVLSVKNVKDVHDIHIWSMDGDYNVMTLHAVLDSNLSLNDQVRTKTDIRTALEGLNVSHLTIEVESPEENCQLADC